MANEKYYEITVTYGTTNTSPLEAIELAQSVIEGGEGRVSMVGGGISYADGGGWAEIKLRISTPLEKEYAALEEAHANCVEAMSAAREAWHDASDDLARVKRKLADSRWGAELDKSAQRSPTRALNQAERREQEPVVGGAA